MYPFFESISIINGEGRNLCFHQERINQTYAHFYPGLYPLELSRLMPQYFKSNRQFKIKLFYNESDYLMTLKLYERKIFTDFRFENIGTLDYEFKQTDRSRINNFLDYKKPFQEIIFHRFGQLTDSSISNIILFDGQDWWTPSLPLLKGTMRSWLIKTKKVRCKQILIDHLNDFRSFKLINAMNNFEEAQDYPISKLIEPAKEVKW